MSFEFLVLLIWCILFFGHISLPDYVTTNAVLTDDKIKWISLLPVGLLGLVFKNSSSLLFPDKDKLEIITDFPDFWILRNMLSVTQFYSVLFAALGVFAWLFDASKNTSLLILTLVAAVIGSGINYWNFHKALATINIIFASKGKIS